MKKQERLVNKIRHLIRQAGLPRFLHRFGPKKSPLWRLCLGLLIKEVFRLSYRRAMKFLDGFYGIKLHWAALQKFRKRVPLVIWQTLLKCAANNPACSILNTSITDGNLQSRLLKNSHSFKAY